METTTTPTARPRAIPTDTFAHRLMLTRAHAGHLSIREAADKCGIGRGAWTNWEKGARPGDLIEIAEIISDALDVDRDWLLFGGQLAAEIRRRDRHGRGVRSGQRTNIPSPTSPNRPMPERRRRVRFQHRHISRTADPHRDAPVTSRTGATRPVIKPWACEGAAA